MNSGWSSSTKPCGWLKVEANVAASTASCPPVQRASSPSKRSVVSMTKFQSPIMRDRTWDCGLMAAARALATCVLAAVWRPVCMYTVNKSKLPWGPSSRRTAALPGRISCQEPSVSGRNCCRKDVRTRRATPAVRVVGLWDQKLVVPRSPVQDRALPSVLCVSCRASTSCVPSKCTILLVLSSCRLMSLANSA